MEPIGTFFDEEWESTTGGIFSSFEADDFNEYGSNFIYNGITSSNFLPTDDTNVNISTETESANFYKFVNSFHTNYQHFSDENSNNNGSSCPLILPTQSYDNNYSFCESNQLLVSNNCIHEYINITSDEFFVPKFPRDVMEMVSENSGKGYNQVSNVSDLGRELNLKRKIDMQDREASGDEKKKDFNHESPKKKPRLPRDAQKGKRKALSKKNKKITMNDIEEENNGTTIDTTQSPCISQDDNYSIIASQDSKGEVYAALNSSGKTRAKKGAATDPQSLYARRRRERINERLRILQNLVPNGTKVDISTMLEEAVRYVEFLKLQIQLLSSDEMWMFAPIAYNGMDMGFYNKISI